MRSVTLALMVALAVSAAALATAEDASAQTRIKPGQQVQPIPTPTLKKKAPPEGKPDIVITQAEKTGPDTFRFFIENHGTKDFMTCGVQIENKTSGGAGIMTVRGLQAGGSGWREAKIWPNVKPGDQFDLYADYGNKIAETNETNNAFSFNW